MRARIGFLLIAVLTACFLASHASGPPLGIGDQDEAVYSHAAIRMAESGGWSTPMFMGRFFLYKPPLLYWLSGASAKLFGVSARALRLPAILASALTAGIVFVWVLGVANWWRAVVAVLLLNCSGLYFDLSRRNMTDAIMMAAIVAVAWILARGRTLWGLAVCIAAGVLAKSIAGLIPILIAAGYWLASTIRPSWKRLAAMTALGLLATAPWFLYQWETHRRWFTAEFIGVEILAYGASAPPQASPEPVLLFYLRRLASDNPFLGVYALLAIPAMVRALRRGRPPELVALLSAVTVTIAAILGYQYHNATYLLPLVPLLAIAAAAYAPAWTFGGLVLLAVVTPGRGVPLRDEATFRLAEQYCEMGRGNELIVVGIDDDFSISTLPLAKLRYAIRGALRSEGQITLDFRSMGIILSAPEFANLDGLRAGYAARLREWGLPNDEALGTVIGWERLDDLIGLIGAHPDRDFLLPSEVTAPQDSTHRRLNRNGATLLVAHRLLSRKTPARRACRLGSTE